MDLEVRVWIVILLAMLHGKVQRYTRPLSPTLIPNPTLLSKRTLLYVA